MKTLASDGTLTGDLTLDPTRSAVQLATKSMWGMARVKGAFTDNTLTIHAVFTR